jgi:hypothetical protein
LSSQDNRRRENITAICNWIWQIDQEKYSLVYLQMEKLKAAECSLGWLVLGFLVVQQNGPSRNPGVYSIQ